MNNLTRSFTFKTSTVLSVTCHFWPMKRLRSGRETDVWRHTITFSSRAINIFKICPLTSMKVCSENIITMERRKDDKFGKNYRPGAGVALEQDFQCVIHLSEVSRFQIKPLTF